MKKKIFCILLAVSMMCSSLVVYAEENPSELEESLKAESPSPAFKNEETEPETTPEFIEKVEPEESPEAVEEASATPEWNGGDDETNIVPSAVPTSIPEESVLPEEGVSPEASLLPSVSPEATQEPTVTPSEVPVEEPTITPGISPEPTVSATPDISITPSASESPSASPIPSVTPSISPEPSISPSPESVAQEDEVLEISGALTVISGTTKLTEDTTVSSVLTSGRGVLDLNGYTLNVTGDVVQQGGTITLDRSTMNVSGNYTQEEGYKSLLKMSYTNDILNIGGSYTTYSTGASTLSNGVMTIEGDLVVGAGSTSNFKSSSNHKVVFSGSSPHLISFSKDNGTTNQIADLKVESGLVTVNNLLIVEKLESDLNVTGINGNELYLTEFGINGHNVTINGNVAQFNHSIDLNGGSLSVTGDFTQQGGTLKINKGTVNIGGNYTQTEGYASYLRMNYTNDILNIGGSFATYSTGSTYSLTSNYLTNGTMTVGGDFIVGAGSATNFYSRVNHTVVLSGNGSHLLSFAKDNYSSIGSQIANLKVESGLITVNDLLRIENLESDLNITEINGSMLYVADLGMNGHNVTINGNTTQFYSSYDSIDLAGGKLTVNGDFAQQGGSVSLNQGTMTVNGNYTQEEGYESTLVMKYTNDILNVYGNYSTKSTSSNTLTAGTMTVTGDFTEGAGKNTKFAASGTHQVRLTGDGVQRVTFENYPSSHFNRLYLSKPMDTGYIFNPNPCWRELISWPFADVAMKEGNWKYDNIKFVYENGIMTGVNPSEFQPDVPLTRAMFASVIYRLAGSPVVTYKSIFSDVPAGKWYSDAVIWAYEKGIVAGLGNGKYGINDNITREQMARMLMEFARVQGYGTGERADFGKFADAAQVSRWATEYMQWAVGSGVISGSTKDGRYYMNPKGQATRAECAVMLTKFIQKNQ